MARGRTVTTNDIGRVFIQRDVGLLACCPEYLGSVGLSGITQDRTENLTFRVASNKQSGAYDVVDKLPGILNQITFDLTSYLGLNGLSVLRELFQENCSSTIHIHFGTCDPPQNFSEFNKAIILDSVLFNSYNTDDLVALTPDNRNVITETVSAEAESMYEYFKTKKYSLVTELDTTDSFELEIMPGGGCGVCTFCSNCQLEMCAENFFTIPSEDMIVATFSDFINIYTVEDNGIIKQWNYELLLDSQLVCSTIAKLKLNLNETVIDAAFYNGNIIVGTSGGRILLFNINKSSTQTLYTIANPIAKIEYNEFGILVASNIGNIYYSPNGDAWSDPTTTGGGAVTALLLYSDTSWLVANLNGNLYYTNDSGNEYIFKKYPKVQGNYLKKFVLSNKNIINAISDVYFYQSFDGGCSFTAVDLSKYFSSLFSIAVCPSNPFVVYIAGLSVDGLKTYIVEINFGA